MDTSFDGMRRNATARMNTLQKQIQLLLDDKYSNVDDDQKEALIEAYNDAAAAVDIMNCLYDDDVEDDINDLGDELSIASLEP